MRLARCGQPRASSGSVVFPRLTARPFSYPHKQPRFVYRQRRAYCRALARRTRTRLSSGQLARAACLRFGTACMVQRQTFCYCGYYAYPVGGLARAHDDAARGN